MASRLYFAVRLSLTCHFAIALPIYNAILPFEAFSLVRIVVEAFGTLHPDKLALKELSLSVLI